VVEHADTQKPHPTLIGLTHVMPDGVIARVPLQSAWVEQPAWYTPGFINPLHSEDAAIAHSCPSINKLKEINNAFFI